MSKLSRIIKNNQQLKNKITTQIKSLGSESSDLTIGKNIKLGGTGDLVGGITNELNKTLTSGSTIKAPSIEGVQNVTNKKISVESTNTPINQVNSRGERTDDGRLIGGYRVVKTLEKRDEIECCYRKLGMVVMVVGEDMSFTEYVLTGHLCSNEGWREYKIDNEDTLVFEDDVIITEDYEILSPEEQIQTQKNLNKLFKDILVELLSRQPADADKNYVHDQFTPSKEWIIAHPLNKKVSVTVTDTAGTVIEGEVTINDGSTVVVKFNVPFPGEAILN